MAWRISRRVSISVEDDLRMIVGMRLSPLQPLSIASSQILERGVRPGWIRTHSQKRTRVRVGRMSENYTSIGSKPKYQKTKNALTAFVYNRFIFVIRQSD